MPHNNLIVHAPAAGTLAGKAAISLYLHVSQFSAWAWRIKNLTFFKGYPEPKHHIRA
jgi:hypothetical protein